MKSSWSVLMLPMLGAAVLGLEGRPVRATESALITTPTPPIAIVPHTLNDSAIAIPPAIAHLNGHGQIANPDADVAQTAPTPDPADSGPTKDPDAARNTQTAVDPLPLTPEEQAVRDLLSTGDRHWQADEIPAATSAYQEAKPPFEQEANYQPPNPALYDATQLSPAGAVYWRIFQEGLNDNLSSKINSSIDLLLTEQPEFIPAYLQYSALLQERENYDAAAELLAGVAVRYPQEPELVSAAVTAHQDAEQWLEASLLARQFVLFSPEHPQVEQFDLLADESFDRYRRKLKRRVSNNIIGGVLTSLAGFVLTGNIWGPLSTAQTTAMLLQGEERIGERIANRVLDDAPMLVDEEVLVYVDEVGQALAAVSGRDEFTYEFHVIMDENLNAFALPGGKIFVNAGSIIETRSEAEFAGLLAHEISHSALSHGFQLVSRGQLTANVVGNLPFGGLATNLLVFGYSRDMERQADRLGTRILASSGYAADGVRNLMVTLDEQNKPSPPAWLSTHPDTGARVGYLEEFILENQLNRYAFEGVDRHSTIRDRVARLLADYEASLAVDEDEKGDENTDEPQAEPLQFQSP